MYIKTIASGSSGNCTYIGSDNTSILVDAGVSKKKICEGLAENGIELSNIDGILITHEHIDHVRALGVIARAYGIRMYATADTVRAISHMKQLGSYDAGLFTSISPDRSFKIGDLSVKAHAIWHDAADPVCYTVSHGDRKISVATDMGDYDDYLVSCLMDSDAMVIEANHDVHMLEVGPYPYELKQRILSKRGHLSNEAGGRLIKRILNSHVKAIYLGHLSKENNLPELAYETVKWELRDNPYTKDVRDFHLSVAKRDSAGDLITV